MTKLLWDVIGERTFETGVDHGVLYPMDAAGVYGTGVPWSGLVNISESPSGGESSPQYADNIQYLNLISAEQFKGTLEAFTYPEEFEVCNGVLTPTPGVRIGQQKRSQFGLVYRTLHGNDVVGESYGYKLHIVYGLVAAPSEKSYGTMNENTEAITFSWELSSTPVVVAGYTKPVSSIVIESALVEAAELAALEDLLFGDSSTGEAQLPLPAAVLAAITPAG